MWRAVDFKGKEAAWNHLVRVVREKYPYSKIKQVVVKDGAVISFGEAHYTFAFGRAVEPREAPVSGIFDEQWQRFMRFCQTLENGVVGEVHFADGRPVLVSMQEPGMELVPAPAQEVSFNCQF